MFGRLFTKMVSEDNHFYKCYDNNAFISCCTKGVSFGDNISSVGSESLYVKRLLVWVFFPRTSCGIYGCSIDIRFQVWRIVGMATIDPSSNSSTLEG
jgi:hypothetical protein